MKPFTRESRIAAAEKHYRALSRALALNQMYLTKAVREADEIMEAELYKARGLIYLKIDEMCDCLQEASNALNSALKHFSKAIDLGADPNITAFCLCKRASLNLARGLNGTGIDDLTAACKMTSSDWQVWFEYGQSAGGFKTV